MKFRCFLAGSEKQEDEIPVIFGSPLSVALWYFERLEASLATPEAMVVVLWQVDPEKPFDRLTYVVKRDGNRLVGREVSYEQETESTI